MTKFEQAQILFDATWTVFAVLGFFVYTDYLSDIAYNTSFCRPRTKDIIWHGVY